MKRAMFLMGLLAAAALAGCTKKPAPMEPIDEMPPADQAAPADSAYPPPPPSDTGSFTPAPAPPAPQPGATYNTQTPGTGQRVHVVQAGENLWKISGMYYGKSSQANIAKIVGANPGLNPDRINAGQRIIIPD